MIATIARVLTSHYNIKRIFAMKQILKYFKRLAAIALLICLFLPLSQCTTQTAYGDKQVHLKYAYNVYTWPSTDAVLALFIFLWPALLTAIVMFRPKLGNNIYLGFTELVLSVGSAYVLIIMLLFSTQILYGGYLALTAFTAYFLSTLGIILGVVWAKWVQRKHKLSSMTQV